MIITVLFIQLPSKAVALPSCVAMSAELFLAPKTPPEPLKDYLSERRAKDLLLENIGGIHEHNKILSRIRELSVLVPDLSQKQRVEIFQYFADLFQKIEKAKFELLEGEGSYQRNIEQENAWNYIKRESQNGIVYFVAANGRANLLYMPDGEVYFSVNKYKEGFDLSDPRIALPTNVKDPRFKSIYKVLPLIEAD